MVWKSYVTCSIILERMLGNILILVMWPKWVHRHLPELTKKRIQLGKTLYRFPDFINRKYFTLILKIMILLNCTGKFCYQYGTFQNTDAPIGRVLKIQIKVSQNSWENTSARVSLLITFQTLGLQLYKKTDSDSCRIKSCSENVWKISRSTSTSDYNF